MKVNQLTNGKLVVARRVGRVFYDWWLIKDKPQGKGKYKNRYSSAVIKFGKELFMPKEWCGRRIRLIVEFVEPPFDKPIKTPMRESTKASARRRIANRRKAKKETEERLNWNVSV